MDAITRAEAAERLLKNEILHDAFTTLYASYTDAWKNSKEGDTAARDNAYRMLRALQSVERHIQAVVENGKLAKHHKAEIEGKARRWL